ncbi:hypothetical protein HBI56_059680 [Parastagonospora nodorum]|uniref:Uncharacterized protein n=1 Tax=Phaeosphaeria nodorum (strain SN15 / ATCC MYA-4574 / FGSC 10173) TaxID=321614 RepID=A0A7U2F258_PHANO|nr:hypothetical protein HBH56_158930 [Parastagonospora nodorum]QRC97345.1 hypothetical protein JI435_410470 [Parastagonospora nodorum SN15]KAH3922482.1 hypothetical protein HBH54_223360 [Parastagonospora nodorum]KAH3946997.1 hypothetical protein HBH53_122980 [Parastagonospora nodorum]KAH3969639.1 hypothetical protein HBH52_170990 [Parastagonospora nodorum]
MAGKRGSRELYLVRLRPLSLAHLIWLTSCLMQHVRVLLLHICCPLQFSLLFWMILISIPISFPCLIVCHFFPTSAKPAGRQREH